MNSYRLDHKSLCGKGSWIIRGNVPDPDLPSIYKDYRVTRPWWHRLDLLRLIGWAGALLLSGLVYWALLALFHMMAKP